VGAPAPGSAAARSQHVFGVMHLAQASAQQWWPPPTALQQPLGLDPHAHRAGAAAEWLAPAAVVAVRPPQRPVYIALSDGSRVQGCRLGVTNAGAAAEDR
jgi:hypothetical protein